MPDFNSTIRNFAKIKVLIIGDVMLDRYLWGTVSRISPEAPVPIVSMEKISYRAGGAANVAANVAGLGAEAFLIGITGEDEDAAILSEVLRKNGVSNFRPLPFKKRKTTTKTRIIAHNQQVVRIDSETTVALNRKESEIVFGKIKANADEANVIILSDYAKGFLTEDFCSRLITYAKEKNKIILVDPKGKDYSKYRGATILTPNQRETAEACNVEYDSQILVEKAGSLLCEELSLEALLITRGEEGMTLLQKGKNLSHLKATARKVFDVTGAGDTVIASMAVALGNGLDFHTAAEIANFAAGLVVEKVGTTAISKELIEAHSQNE